MSKVKSIVKEPAEETTPEPLFEPFKWHHEEVEKVKLPGSRVMDFTGQVIDVTLGVKTILEMKHFDKLQGGFDGDQRLLNEHYHGNLERLCIASLEMLYESAEGLSNWAYEYQTPEGRAEHGNPDLGF